VSILRKVVAVIILGYGVFAGSAVLLFRVTERDPHAPQNLGFIVFAVLYGITFAGLGGLLAARIAPTKRNFSAAFVAFTIALVATVSLIARPGAGLTWSQWAALVLMAPSAWAAATLFVRRAPK
jgi:ABC-type transport system involved in multi-copper enzyme maturation permease subunit